MCDSELQVLSLHVNVAGALAYIFPGSQDTLYAMGLSLAELHTGMCR